MTDTVKLVKQEEKVMLANHEAFLLVGDASITQTAGNKLTIRRKL